MNVVITGHRIQKLESYDTSFIKESIKACLVQILKNNFVMGYSGMASGVDLWFCEACKYLNIPYVACVPFVDQEQTMCSKDADNRKQLLKTAAEHRIVKNSWMVEKAHIGIVVWDGNKGGTHNVLQQLIENKKNFYWINPVSQKVWTCF